MSDFYKKIKGTKNYYITSNGYVFKKVGDYNFQPVAINPRTTAKYLGSNVQLKNGKWVSRLVHLIVAEAFLSKGRGRRNLEINHINGDKNDNRVTNLEWVSHKVNMTKGWKNGQFDKVRDAIVKKRKELNNQLTNLLPDDVRQIRRLKRNGFTNKQLGYIFKLHEQQISRICNYHSFKNVV